MTKASRSRLQKKGKRVLLTHLLDDKATGAWCGAEFDSLSKIATKPERVTCDACKKLANDQLEKEGIEARL